MPTMSDAQQIAQYKSGKYSVERPLHLGAAVAGHLAEFGDALSAVGMPLGEAFQYRDDLLGVYGDPTKTGKPVGHDLVEAKPTVLIASAFAGATPSQKTQLDRLFGAPELSDTDVDTLKQLLDDTGARAKTETLIERQTNNSLEAIQELRTRGFGANAAEFLELLVHLITDRNA
jgi:geranylgeranyl diphosphate synthase type I